MRQTSIFLMRLQPQELRMVSCKNVRNRDLFFLTNPEIKLQHMTCLVLGDDHSKPWVSNK